MAKQIVFTAKAGSVWLTVNKYQFVDRGMNRTQYRFSYTEHGKTKHVTSTSFERIKTLARERASLIRDGQVSLPSPLQENSLIEQCRVILGGSLENIVSACRHYASTVLSVSHRVHFGESIEEYLTERKPHLIEHRYAYVKRTLNKIFKPTMLVAELTSPDIDDIIRETKGSQRTKYDVYTTISSYLNWAERKGHISNVAMLLNRVTVRGKKTEGQKEIFSADELQRLFNACNADDVRTVFALCAFGGMRKAEALRVRWNQIDLVDNVIRLDGDQVKTRTRRGIEILPTLKAWLELVPVEDRDGQVWTRGEDDFSYHQQTTAKRAKVEWKNNGLRHTAISCRCCNGVTLSEVADWAGNSVSEIKKHYLQLISKADALAWWNVLPK
jgi:integrase